MTKILDANTVKFEQLVIEGSASGYILVDFWASWCQPCQALKPILEKLTNDYDFTLVKVNTEENQELAAQLGVRGIPDVRLYRDGAEVDRFSGALAENQVRSFLEKYLPSSVDAALNHVVELASSGDEEAANEAFNRLLKDHPDSGKIKLAAAQYLASQGEHADATEMLLSISASEPEYAAARAILSMDELRLACESGEGAEGLDKDFADAACAAMSQQFEQALDGFLQIVKQDRNYNDGAAHKAMLTMFNVIGRENELVQRYQRLLASALY